MGRIIVTTLNLKSNLKQGSFQDLRNDLSIVSSDSRDIRSWGARRISHTSSASRLTVVMSLGDMPMTAFPAGVSSSRKSFKVFSNGCRLGFSGRGCRLTLIMLPVLSLMEYSIAPSDALLIEEASMLYPAGTFDG